MVNPALPVSELDDIQGLLRSGYGGLVEAMFLLLQVSDPAAARLWVGAVAGGPWSGEPIDRVTSIGDLRERRAQAMQIAFSAPGLRRLGVADQVIQGFAPEFYDGMASAVAQAAGRSRRLGDAGDNAPSRWRWGAGPDMPDAVLLLYAGAGGLATLVARVKSVIAAGFTIRLELPTTTKIAAGQDRLEHFGFIDGISQPAIDWKALRDPCAGEALHYGNLITPGEFLLGYVNEYGIFEDRPLLAPEQDPRNILAPAADDPARRDLARNGTYLVFRQLSQDVDGFWQFVAGEDPGHDGKALAELLVGRRLATGAPLVAQTNANIAGVGPGEPDVARNNFSFYDDPDGLVCPLGAHIRRANPRTADLPGGEQGFVSRLLRMLGLRQGGPRDDLISSSRFHRILRRGRSYGAFVDRAPGEETGLHFIALNANIARQFEFIQSAWLANPTFDGMSGESDPLLGNRVDFPAGHATNGFTLSQPSGPCRRLANLPQFTAVRGGGYFFLPSLRALRYFGQADVAV